MVKRMGELCGAYRAGGLPVLQRSIARLSERGARTFGYLLVDNTGHRIMGITNIATPSPGWTTATVYDMDDQSDDPARVLAVRLDRGAILAVIADQDYIERFDGKLMQLFAVGAGVFIILALAGGFAIDRIIRLRLDPIANMANAIIAGRLDQRIPVGGGSDEFDRIASVINIMVDRLNALILEVQRTSSFIAHDLRVPLVGLHDDLALHGGCVDPTSYIDTLSEARQRTAEIISLFDAILRISRLGDGFFINTVLDLSDLVFSLSESFSLVAEESGKRMLFDSIASGMRVQADQHLLNQLVVNLLDNSLQHSPVGGTITVSLVRDDEVARLEIENDDNPGTEAFATNTGAPPYAANRAGFGLALVRAIASVHGGQFETTRAGKRFRAIATIPIHPF
jgi:signal transduction histidine kinase